MNKEKHRDATMGVRLYVRSFERSPLRQVLRYPGKTGSVLLVSVLRHAAACGYLTILCGKSIDGGNWHWASPMDDSPRNPSRSKASSGIVRLKLLAGIAEGKRREHAIRARSVY